VSKEKKNKGIAITTKKKNYPSPFHPLPTKKRGKGRKRRRARKALKPRKHKIQSRKKWDTRVFFCVQVHNNQITTLTAPFCTFSVASNKKKQKTKNVARTIMENPSGPP
jgi:copper oxidase (laccase) domain-containing protein